MSADFFATISQNSMLPQGDSEDVDVPTVPAAPSNGGYLGLLPDSSETGPGDDSSESSSEDSGTDTWLKSMLLRVGLLSTDQLSEALRAEAMTGKDFETIVVERGWIDPAELERLIEERKAEQPAEPTSEITPEFDPQPLDVDEPEPLETVTHDPTFDPEPIDTFGPLPLPAVEFEVPPSVDPFESALPPSLSLPDAETEPQIEPHVDSFDGPELPAFPEPFGAPFAETPPETTFDATEATETGAELEPFGIEQPEATFFEPEPESEPTFFEPHSEPEAEPTFFEPHSEPEPTFFEPEPSAEPEPAFFEPEPAFLEPESEPAPVVELAPPVLETQPEPVVEAQAEPVVEAQPEPVVTVAPEPIVHTPAITPEPRVEPRPETAEVTVVHRVFARLSNGERVQVTSSADRNAARSEAKALMAYLQEAAGDWPFLSARFVRPEAIISVDLETELL